jgi:hypothetical protein
VARSRGQITTTRSALRIGTGRISTLSMTANAATVEPMATASMHTAAAASVGERRNQRKVRRRSLSIRCYD